MPPDSTDLRAFSPQKSIPRSVYIHIPFCRHRCGYCNFSLVAGRDYLIDRYMNALEKEISLLDQMYEIDTLFLGGGTPSHLSPEQLARLGEIIRSRFATTRNAEFSAECNPNDLDQSLGNALGALGVNRISLGIQSLNPAKLERLERSHKPVEIVNAVAVAKSFATSVSIDLIFAAPEETLSEWHSDLDDALDLDADHLSTYELTYEKGTRFWARRTNGQLSESEQDLRAAMYTDAIERIEQFGAHQYEVSSFSKPDHLCKHNRIYWTGEPYFAFGSGASRFIDGIRETNHQSPMQYMKRIESDCSAVAEREELTGREAAKERLAVGLRMLEGLQGIDFKNRTGYSIPDILGKLETHFSETGLLISTEESWRLSPKGVLMADWIAEQIMSN